MFDVGGGELILIILAILLLFGPEKLPEFTKTINKGLRKVKQAQAQFQNQINEIQKDVEKTLDVDAKPPAKTDFKPKPPTDNKIGAFDQLDLDKNFVTESGKNQGKTEEKESSVENSGDDVKNVEKTTTKKNVIPQNGD